ncbi:MAG: hypothetical protein R3F62_14025 [Planctomycetota bacterium]
MSGPRCPFCRGEARGTLACPRCAAPVHPGCGWELARCPSCDDAALLERLATARQGDAWAVGRGWAACVSHEPRPDPAPLVPRLRLSLDPASLRSPWLAARVELALGTPTWIRALTLATRGDAQARLALLPAGERDPGTWAIEVRVRRAGLRPLELRVGLVTGGLLRRTRWRTGLRVAPPTQPWDAAGSSVAPVVAGSTERSA